MDLSFELNGRQRSASVDRRGSLLELLRDGFGLNGPKYGCGLAQCGACTVLVDGAPARACVMRAARIGGRRVTTLEGLADPELGVLHPVQQGFVDCQGAQCGYCLNGMVMTACALLERRPDPTEDEIRQALRDNLCRCGAHREIIASVRRAAAIMNGHGRADEGAHA
jgi:nicotinate dehydrogenase subunit A